MRQAARPSPADAAGVEPLARAAAAPAARRSAVRIEIQALRCVAVLLVVVYHLWPSAMPGGFVGVDVFFVISGFLITSLLVREIERRGSLSLSAFWARRARRILPAALLTLLVCGLATIVFVPLPMWRQFFGDITASTAYVQNWHLSATAVDYFAADQGPSPVQHYWSLSAEEQFYILWPLLLIAALALTRGRAPRIRLRALAVAMGLLTLASLVVSVYGTASNPAAAYFATPARAWEFGVGGLLALLPDGSDAHDTARCALSWLGLGSIALAGFLYTDTTPFPGVAAALPVVGALAVIRAGAPTARWAPSPLLGVRPVQFVGDISYSVYLWHWPLLVLAPFVIGGGVHTPTRITIVMLTLVLAWLSKVLVEDPMRAARFLTRRPASWTFALAAVGTGVVMAVNVGGTAHVQSELRKAQRATDAVLASAPACFGAASRDPLKPCRNPKLRLSVVPTPLEARDRPNAPCKITQTKPIQICEFGTSRAKAQGTIALFGDSHASHWRAALEVVARAHRWHGLSITRTSCPFSLAERNIPEPGRSSCTRWRRDVLRWLTRHPEVNIAFVSELAGGGGVVPVRGQDRAKTELDGYMNAWKAMPASVRHIVVIRDNPKVLGDTDVCVERAIRARRPASPACAVPRRVALSSDPAVTAASRLGSPRVQSIDLTEFFCDRRRCYPVIGGALVNKDVGHLTTVYAKTLAPYLGRDLDALMRSWSAQP